MSRKIGSLFARITEQSYPRYQIDFTRHNGAYDSDDEENERQWSHAVSFTYENGLFLNAYEFEYDTRERYTCKIFWSSDSTTIMQLLEDTFQVRRAKKDPLPPWSLSAIQRAAELAWERRSSH